MFPYTLSFGTYSFPNQTFELQGHTLQASVPIQQLQRQDGGVVLDGSLSPKTFMINGKMYSADIDTLHEAVNILKKSIHNKGRAAYLQSRADRRTLCRMGPAGVNVIYEKGLYQYVVNVQAQMVTDRPFAESPTIKNGTLTLAGNTKSFIDSFTNAGHYPTNPIFTFIAGASFTNNLHVMNNANSFGFDFIGPLLNGQTLVIDCDAGCVLLHVGATLVDAMSYFQGDIFMALEEGANSVVMSGATLTYLVNWKDRWYL
jgi:hypothetical protein